jgi:hypothetical protein
VVIKLLHRLNSVIRGGRIPVRATAWQIYGPAAPTAAQESAFFASVYLPNGTRKTTSDHRLDDLNALIATEVPDRRPLRVKDVGISSGQTTLEWLDQLAQAGVEAEMTGTDVAINGELILVDDEVRVLVDGKGNPLQWDLLGYAVPPRPRIRDRLLYGPIIVRARRRLEGRPRVPIRLLSPRLLARSDVTAYEEDLLRPIGGRTWDVVRAANVLNLGYFPADVLRVMVDGITSTLAEGGVLAVCRTELDGTNNATVFRLSADGYAVAGRLGSGSEIEDIVLAARRPASHDGVYEPAASS